jgi:hypothetical protein
MNCNWKNDINTKINDTDLSNKLICSISRFLENEKFILENSLNERTISFKLAEYLNREFTDYDVDCEYNRMVSGNIDLQYIQKTLNLEIDEISSDDTNGTTVYPDIIVHKRGNNDNNLLVIEVKKKEFADRTRKSTPETYREFDFRKLEAYTQELYYQYGLYIEFDKANISMLKIFNKGNKL